MYHGTVDPLDIYEPTILYTSNYLQTSALYPLPQKTLFTQPDEHYLRHNL